VFGLSPDGWEMESFQVSLNNFLILFFSGSSSLLLIRSNSVSTEDVTVVSSACNLSGPSETSFNCFCKFSTSLQSSSLSKMCAIFFFIKVLLVLSANFSLLVDADVEGCVPESSTECHWELEASICLVHSR